MQPAPAVSIVLPTYNRGDVIARAVDSVRRQTFEDWELLVVDDGSRDATAERLHGLDPRLRVLTQSNQGVYAARNAGIACARGRFVAFLDSDDEWLPQFLELTQAFFQASPEDQFVTTEFFDDWGGSLRRRQDLTEIATRYAPRSRALGSTLLELPPGETDEYLRVYRTREPLGNWGGAIAGRAGHPGASLYRGRIFEAMRWGYLNWLPVLVVRRAAVDAVGPFPAEYRSAADYRFLALLAREYRANMISAPLAVRHNKGVAGKPLGEDHLASGAAEHRFATNKLALFDELYWNDRRGDPELARVRALHALAAGRVALALGLRDGREHLHEARRVLPKALAPSLGEIALSAFPHAGAAALGYRALARVRAFSRSLAAGEVRLAGVRSRLAAARSAVARALGRRRA